MRYTIQRLIINAFDDANSPLDIYDIFVNVAGDSPVFRYGTMEQYPSLRQIYSNVYRMLEHGLIVVDSADKNFYGGIRYRLSRSFLDSLNGIPF